jgi:hypothetical protein
MQASLQPEAQLLLRQREHVMPRLAVAAQTTIRLLPQPEDQAALAALPQLV